MTWAERSEPDLRTSLEPFWSCLQHVIGWYNAPPWDTWVAMMKDAAGGHPCPHLVAWIPPQFVQLADRGVDANPEECIQWLDRADVHLRKVLAQEVDLSWSDR